MKTEGTLDLIKLTYNGKNTVIKQIQDWFETIEIDRETIKDYIIFDFLDEWFVSKKYYTIYKSFDYNKKQEAVNYCLDKINTESNQMDLFKL